MATLIGALTHLDFGCFLTEGLTYTGLSIRVRLLRSLPDRFKVDIRVKEGSHESENSRMSRFPIEFHKKIADSSGFCVDLSEQATQRQRTSRSCIGEQPSTGCR